MRAAQSWGKELSDVSRRPANLSARSHRRRSGADGLAIGEPPGLLSAGQALVGAGGPGSGVGGLCALGPGVLLRRPDRPGSVKKHPRNRFLWTVS